MEGKVPLEVALLKKLEDVPGVVHLIECIDMGDGFAIVFENDGIYKDLFDVIIEKSQNCVKAAIAFVCTTCKRQLLFALLQKITFVCTIATDN